MPVQRIPRYKLLLDDLLRYTPLEHPDLKDLTQACQLISQGIKVDLVADFVNETIRHHEAVLSMIDIQKSLIGFHDDLLVPGRVFLKKGKLFKISRKTHQTRYLFLFSDILLYTSPGLLEDQFIFHRKLQLDQCRIETVPDTSSAKHIFQIVTREKSFALYCDSVQEKQAWMNALNDAIRDRRAAQSTLKKDPHQPTNVAAQGLVFDAPVWIPDEYANNCMVCSAEFHFYNRKHHCR